MSSFWIAIALKATLWAAMISSAVLVVPAHHPQARRRLALLGMWGLWVVPWLCVPLPEGIMPDVQIPESIEPSSGLWTSIMAALWAAGSLLLLLRMLREASLVLRMVRAAAAAALNVEGGVDVRFSDEVHGPCMAGWLRPCVLLPRAAASWPGATLRAALRHELQHARQGDGLHRFCAALVRACFWWNPAMHFLCGIYEAESEVCCDAAAATACSPREYGEMLLAHATHAPMPALAMSFARRSGLRVRLQRLFDTRRASRWVLSARWLGACILVFGGCLLMGAMRAAPSGQGSLLRREALLRLSANPFPGSP
ncbi:M56 family metallopeptidase [Prosthecobacter sp.]|uniref:M56 family metallopeptidase n=1 Tax=Prosthecobacter sp. TaxID=1965333 RepID=UPI00378412BB